MRTVCASHASRYRECDARHGAFPGHVVSDTIGAAGHPKADGGQGMRSIALVLLGVSFMAATGCAAARNTPAQELPWERWRACDRFSTIALDRIDTDGRLVVKGYEVEAAQFTA